jgi:hypothetical protein
MKKWCDEGGLIFKIINFGKVESSIFDNLIETNSVILNKTYMKKYLKMKEKLI